MFNSVITLKVSSIIIGAIIIALASAGTGFLIRGNASQECLSLPITKPSSTFKPIPNNDGRRF